MESGTPTITRQRLLNDAVLYAQSSELATQLHEGLGYVLGAEIAFTNNAKWSEFGTHAVACSLDGADGKLKDLAVRAATKALYMRERNIRDNKPTPDEWAVLKQHDIVDNPRGDERTDKRYFYSRMGALTVRMARNGYTKTAAVLSANMAVSKVRDDAKGSLRDTAQQQGWETNAKVLGKVKTSLHGIGIGTLLTPIFDNGPGRLLGSAIISAGTLIGIADYGRYKSYVTKQKNLVTKNNLKALWVVPFRRVTQVVFNFVYSK